MKGKGISTRRQRIRYVLCDLFTSAIAFLLFNIYRYYALDLPTGNSLGGFLGSQKLVLEQVLVPVGMLGVYWLSGYYNRPFDKSRLQELVTTFFSAALNVLLIFLIFLIDDQTLHRAVSYEMLAVLFMLLLASTYTGRVIITHSAIARLKDRRWAFNTIIVGNSRMARQTAFNLSKTNSRLGYNIIGFVNITGEKSIVDESNVFPIDDLDTVCRELKIDQLIISPEVYDEERVLKLLFKLFKLDIPIKIAPDTMSYVTSGIHMQDIYGEPFVDLTSPRCSESANNVKRLFDVVLSASALVVLSPLLAVLAILVKRSSPGPVIYSQERIGYRQRPFDIYKFRSMHQDAESQGPCLSSEGDSRITPLGRVMRKYRLDELPQFWNVLKGDMSVVGPRPEREFFIRQIVRKAPYYTLVHQVRPGITSWGMVKYGYASTIEQMVERTRFDLIYLSNMSTLVDFKIMIYTVKTIITGRGV